MKIKYLASLAIASTLMVSLAACSTSNAPSAPEGETQTDVADPCAGADPCASVDPCAGADPCAADPCAADPCAADPCAADPCASS